MKKGFLGVLLTTILCCLLACRSQDEADGSLESVGPGMYKTPGKIGAACGSRGQAPCAEGLQCKGSHSNDGPGTCVQVAGALNAACGSRGMKPCNPGLECVGAQGNDAPGRCQ